MVRNIKCEILITLRTNQGNQKGSSCPQFRSHLRDPFYTGVFIYAGKLYKGQHKALMSDEEFNFLQDILDGRAKGKLIKHDFVLR